MAAGLAEVDAEFPAVLTPALIEGIVESIPEEWLTTGIWTEGPAQVRRVYSDFLNRRVEHSSVFVEYARKAIV